MTPKITRAYENKEYPERCPVKMYEKYMSLRNTVPYFNIQLLKSQLYIVKIIIYTVIYYNLVKSPISHIKSLAYAYKKFQVLGWLRILLWELRYFQLTLSGIAGTTGIGQKIGMSKIELKGVQ
ncbi:hypothetical protein LOTGIDRAFT_157620 [Lottia gigantea]|uniref:Uncharacterized protein n=1 Tax=Lottia gigantea TaxID=225164 RepID=V4B1Z1_LOTGI|nr:hypothetical protein LOTGIDRAFT_157620 [Lottia gigantea]ESP01436.1 hypothetical protein LOTGIDRAFT_157620 [Lottia gigantea]